MLNVKVGGIKVGPLQASLAAALINEMISSIIYIGFTQAKLLLI